MTALSFPVDDPLALLLHEWLMAKKDRTGSKATEREYGKVMSDLCRDMHLNGLDLDGDAEAVASFVQTWVRTPKRLSKINGELAASTRKQRLAIISSFYEYAVKHKRLRENPITVIEYPKVEDYQSARPLAIETVMRKLEAIDRTNLVGLRDLALLLVAFKTGRRAAELAAMNLGDMAALAGVVTVRWPHTKGGKSKIDMLERDASTALLLWMTARLGPQWAMEGDDTPVWVRLEGNHEQLGQRLGYHGIRGIYQRRLGTTKVHTSRHTFAHLLIKSATVQELSARLGHASLDVTARYLQKIGEDTQDRTQIGDLIQIGEE